MKILKTLFQIVLVCSFLGSAFVVFEDWKTALMIDVLVILVVAQILFVASKLTIRKQDPAFDPEKIANVISAIKKAPASVKEKNKPTKPTKKKPELEKKDGQKIDPALFSKFQSNLKDSQKNRADDDNEVVLSLSSKSKSKNKKNSNARSADHLKNSMASGLNKSKNDPLKKIKVPAGGLDSAFDDLRETETITNKLNPRKKPIPDKPENSEKGSKVKPPMISNEVLTSKDLSSGGLQVLENEAELVLNAAEKAYREGNFEQALSSVTRWFQSNYKYNTNARQNKDLAKMKADCEFSLLRYDLAASSYQDYFKRFCSPSEKDYLAEMDEVIDNFSLSIQQKHAIHFMFTALNEHRQAGNQVRMDGIYKEIEQAYRQLEDWPRLIQTYQNHLSIKKMIKDHQGQLEILDHLGKLQYDQGDADGSKQSYEESMAIKKQIGEL